MEQQNKKRDNYISWNEYFMGIALLSSLRSKDPNTQVGCCIVSSDKRILSMGYNGFPAGCSDDEYPWGKEGNDYDIKYTYVVHAELNAILNYKGPSSSLKGSTLYTTLFPCNECVKAIIQSGIAKVVYYSDKHADTDTNRAAKRMLDSASIPYEQYESTWKDDQFGYGVQIEKMNAKRDIKIYI
jgi:dCMP deaminase